MRPIVPVLLAGAVLLSGCVAPLEYAYYDARWTSAHDALLGSMRAVDDAIRDYRNGSMTHGELEAAGDASKSRVREALGELDGLWPPEWNRSVTTLRVAGNLYLDIVHDVVVCNGGPPPPGAECDDLLGRLVLILGHAVDAAAEKPRVG